MAEGGVEPHASLTRVVAVLNGKGGVGKTSITCNCAGQLARGGLRVLVVDLDVSGNVKLDLGLVEHPDIDDGRGLVDSVWSNKPLHLVVDARPGVDVIPGGKSLEILGALSQMTSAQELPGGSVPAAFAVKLAEIADDYDMVFIDCPPGNKELQEMALGAARWVLIPTKTDPASWDGLLMVGPRVKQARRENPDLDYLGVVVFDHSPNASRLMRNTRERLGEVGETVPLLDAFVRHSQGAAQDCRSRGQLADELARDASAQTHDRLAALSSRRAHRDPGSNVITLPVPPQLSGSADSVAADYTRLAQEICTRISAAENAAAGAGSNGRGAR